MNKQIAIFLDFMNLKRICCHLKIFAMKINLVFFALLNRNDSISKMDVNGSYVQQLFREDGINCKSTTMMETPYYKCGNLKYIIICIRIDALQFKNNFRQITLSNKFSRRQRISNRAQQRRKNKFNCCETSILANIFCFCLNLFLLRI